jgi:hypothetical protein
MASATPLIRLSNYALLFIYNLIHSTHLLQHPNEYCIVPYNEAGIEFTYLHERFGGQLPYRLTRRL